MILPGLLTAIAVFGFLGLSLYYTLPANVLGTRFGNPVALTFNILASENYAFFTKNPQSPSAGVYRAVGDRYFDLLSTPQNRPANLFGLTRTQRAQGPELAFLDNAPSLTWHTCGPEVGFRACLARADAEEPTRVRNTSPLSTICGTVYLTQEEAVPFEFRDFRRSGPIVSRVARVDAECGR